MFFQLVESVEMKKFLFIISFKLFSMKLPLSTSHNVFITIYFLLDYTSVNSKHADKNKLVRIIKQNLIKIIIIIPAFCF